MAQMLAETNNMTHVLNVAGANAFAASWFPRINWDILLEQLNIDADEFEDYFRT